MAGPLHYGHDVYNDHPYSKYLQHDRGYQHYNEDMERYHLGHTRPTEEYREYDDVFSDTDDDYLRHHMNYRDPREYLGNDCYVSSQEESAPSRYDVSSRHIRARIPRDVAYYAQMRERERQQEHNYVVRNDRKSGINTNHHINDNRHHGKHTNAVKQTSGDAKGFSFQDKVRQAYRKTRQTQRGDPHDPRGRDQPNVKNKSLENQKRQLQDSKNVKQHRQHNEIPQRKVGRSSSPYERDRFKFRELADALPVYGTDNCSSPRRYQRNPRPEHEYSREEMPPLKQSGGLPRYGTPEYDYIKFHERVKLYNKRGPTPNIQNYRDELTDYERDDLDYDSEYVYYR